MSPVQLFSAHFEHQRPFQLLPPRSLLHRKTQMAQRIIDPDAVQRELGKLQRTPPTSKEQEIASRSLVRFARASKEGDDEHAIHATEEWVRLCIALRRAGGTGVERLSAETLRTWHTRVCRQFSLKRKCFLVPKAQLAALPEYPPDLDRFVVPAGSLDLPADIYEKDILIVDDGFDRSKLNFPGVMQVELACKFTREFPSSGPGREGQLSFPAAPAAASFQLLPAPAAVPLQFPATPKAVPCQLPAAPAADSGAPASSGSVLDLGGQRGLKRRVSDAPVDSEREPETGVI